MYTMLKEVHGREEQFKGHSEKPPAKTRMQLIFKINDSIPPKNKTQRTRTNRKSNQKRKSKGGLLENKRDQRNITTK